MTADPASPRLTSSNRGRRRAPGRPSSPGRGPRALAFLGALGLAAAGCSNPACDTEVVERLLTDCQLIAGPAAICPTTNIDEAIQLQVDACNITDPSNLDVDCLRSADCSDIEMGACFTGEGGSSQRSRDCVRGCLQEEQRCSEPCGAMNDFAGCSACELECARAYRSCEDGCPD